MKTKRYLHTISKKNWENIAVAYKKDINSISDYLLKTGLREDDDNYFLSNSMFTDMCNKLSLSPYDIKVGVSKEIQIVPKYRGIQEGIDENFLSIKRRITKAHYLREHFLEVRADLEMDTKSNYFDYSKLKTDQDIINYLELESKQYRNKVTESGNKNSKIVFLKRKIFDLGCLVFETGTHAPRMGCCSGAYLDYDEWPIILLNSNKTNPQRKIFTLLHEFSHFLDSRKKLHDNDKNFVLTHKEDIKDQEIEANNFASRILFPKKHYIDKAEYINNMSLEDFLYWLKSNIRKLGVSELSQVLTLKRHNILNQDKYKEWEINYSERRDSQIEKEKNRSDKGVKTHWPTDVAKRIGPSFIGHLEELYISNQYSRLQVAKSFKTQSINVEDIFEYWRQ